MSLAFSSLQQRCLDTLGYTLYTLAGSKSDPNMTPAQTLDPTMIAAVATRDARLFAAVLRAARIQTDIPADPQAWLSQRGVDSIASLRGDPAAKRALWTLLRRERRTP